MNDEHACKLFFLLGLSQRAMRLLIDHDITSAEQLVRLTESEMRSWRGCGQKTVNEIHDLADVIEGKLANPYLIPCDQ